MSAGGCSDDRAGSSAHSGRCRPRCVCLGFLVELHRQIPLHGIGLNFTATPLAIYLAGAVSVIFLGLGFALILRGTGREWGGHKELKQLRKKKATPATGKADGSADDSTSNGSDNSTELLPERHRD
jgi:hypothetical protein